MDFVIITKWLESIGTGLFLMALATLPLILGDDGRLPPVDDEDE